MNLFSILRPLVERFPKLAAIYRGMRDQFDGMAEPVQTPWTFKLGGNAAMANGGFEPDETELIRMILGEADILVNVGANIGYYCCHALSLGKPVIAFEPMSRNLGHLCRNIAANGWPGAEIFPMALSNRVGILEIFGGDTGASLVKGWAGIPESYKTLVPCSTMDTVLGSRLRGKRSLVLVDIEGAEKGMLEGASLMLGNDPKPVWLMEIMLADHQPEGTAINPDFVGVFEIFFRNGYQAFIANQDMRAIGIDEVRAVAIGAAKFESHNFVFRDAQSTGQATSAIGALGEIK